MSPTDLMHEVDRQLAHVWMVRAFLKHSEEAEEDEDLREVHRALYDYMLALGGPLQANDAAEYLKLARKKLGKLCRAADSFTDMQPEISTHTNYQMAVASLNAAVGQIERMIGSSPPPVEESEEDWSE